MSSDFEPTPDASEAGAGGLLLSDEGELVVSSTGAPLRVAPLRSGERAEVLAFLASSPLHNVALSGLVLDNGLESFLNRGRFYSCRAEGGALEGVALIGHTVLLDARTDGAAEAFALVARGRERKHLVMGEVAEVERFWNFYAAGTGLRPRFTRRVMLLERRGVTAGEGEPVKGLRPATLSDLAFVMTIQAEMATEESGTNPLESDRLGFHVRCARRVERGRAWVCVNEGRPAFKADVLAQTPEAAYLEGIYVSPDMRGRGLGSRCLAQMCRALQRAGTKSVCLFVDERNQRAFRFYEAAGFTPVSPYLILYF
ncbi:MAG TPA: GNAT family N-acetyltransferase [Pyrinomonadaceae bacterium]|nr:GNAT family N-acetyltransferase [Pyrinomonadaceae bacterium]